MRRVLALLAMALLAVAASPLLAQAPSPGPPREGPVAGDEAAATLSDTDITNLRRFTRVYTVARWFHPSDAALAADWDALAVEAVPQVIAARSDAELSSLLKDMFGPIVEGFEVSTQPFAPITSVEDDNIRWRWVHSGFEGSVRTGYSRYRTNFRSLGPGPFFEEAISPGLWVRFPIRATKSGEETPAMVKREQFPGKPEGWVPAGFDRSTRIAATIVGWDVLDQFYPYWDEVGVDWDARFADQLQRAATAQDDSAFRDALNQMMHELRDGHARVVYTSPRRSIMPVVFNRIGDAIVIGWAGEGIDLPPGSQVITIDGESVEERLARSMDSFSGSSHFRELRALDDLAYGPADSIATLTITSPAGENRTVTIPRVPLSLETYPRMPRPDAISDVGAGLLYVDLTHADDAQLVAAADRLAAARGIVCDLRGRPAGTFFILSHLTDQTIRSARFDIPVRQLPDQVGVHYSETGWWLAPQSPRLTDNVVFLTGASAASYPESIIGTVKANGLGTIVGSATAGANGNVAVMDLPGGYRLFFTGMKVTNRDGSAHHNIGVLPDVAVQPTLDGVRAGRDEVLAAGVEIVRGRAGNDVVGPLCGSVEECGLPDDGV